MIKNFALRRFIVFNRLPIAAGLILIGLLLGFKVTWWIAWIPFLAAIIMVLAHFLIGPMTLLQVYMEAGDMEGAQALLARVTKPEWLYKPVRSQYFMLRGKLSSLNSNNLDAAETDIRRSLENSGGSKEEQGIAYFELGQIAMQKGNSKEALESLRKAVSLGLPDKDSEAAAYLLLCNICVNRRDNRSAKIYFNKAKACKPRNEQIVGQLVELGKYMARIPG